MDYKGQHDAERVGQAIIILGFIVGTTYGWVVQSLVRAFYGWMAGLLVALIVCVPPWPCFCRHPIKWLPNPDDGEEEEEEGSEEGGGEEKEETGNPDKVRGVKDGGVKKFPLSSSSSSSRFHVDRKKQT